MKKFLPLLFLIAACETPTVTYRYEVSGTSNNYSVTMINGQGGTEQYTTGAFWSYWEDQDLSRFLYVSAQNNNSSGTVVVKILQDGSVIKTSTCEGGYCIATATR